MINDNYSRLTKWTIFIVAAIYIIPVFLLGHNCYIRLHDTLEGEWSWLKILTDSHQAFNFNPHAIVPQVMNGQPRNVYPTGLSVNMLLVQWLGMFNAYLVSSLLIRIIGFTGMALLLCSYFITRKEDRFIVWSCALAFSVLSVFTPFGLSVMGQPLILWAFLNLRSGKKLITSYLIIVAFPLYSSIVWFAIPFLALLGLTGIYFFCRKELNLHYVLGFILLAGMFVLVNFPILSVTFSEVNFVSIRSAYNLYMFAKPGIGQSIGDTLLMLLVTHYHIATFIPLVSLIAVLLVVKRTEQLLVVLLIAVFGICIFQGFYSFPEYWLSDKTDLVKSFRFNRFSVLLPFLWLLAFGIALMKMRDSELLRPFVLPFIYVQLFMALAANDEVLHNYRMLSGHQKFPGYENYLAPKQFESIKQYIGLPAESYKVASLGISPSVAQYNGLYTLDGLMSVYDLHYKEKFRKVFAGEIDKSKDLQQYFDGWGNRCYIFSSELGYRHDSYNCYKFKNRTVEHFDFNGAAFKELGGKYLISAVEIQDHKEHHLHLEKVFTDSQSWWRVYLYSIE
jgi:hypothetical protein